MPPLAQALAAALAFVALLVPPRGLAELLVGPEDPRLATVVLGAWALKGALLVAAVLVALAAWLARRPASGEPLLRELPVAEPVSASEGFLMGALLVLALVLRLHDLGDQLWFDEIDTLVHHVRLPLGEVLATYQSKNQHYLYSVLARLAIAAFGESPWALRLPAALLGAASVAAAWGFGRLVAGRAEALAAAALLALSYHHLWFSQNARGYTGMLLLALLASGAFLRCLAARGAPDRARHALLYGLWAGLAVAVHLTSLFLVAAHGVLWLALLARRRRPGSAALAPGAAFLFAGGMALLAYALVLPQLFGTAFTELPGPPTAWRNPLWFVAESLAGLARGLPGGWLALGAATAVGVAGLASYARRTPWVLAFLLAPSLVTAAVVIAMSHNLWPRFFFFSAGFYVLIAVRGLFACAAGAGRMLGAARPQRLAAAAAVLVCAGSSVALPRAYGPKQDFLGALEFVRAEAAPEDAVVTVEMTKLPYGELFPSGFRPVDAPEQLLQIEARHPRTWIVYTAPTLLEAWQPEIWRRIRTEYETAASFPGTVGGSDVVVAVRH